MNGPGLFGANVLHFCYHGDGLYEVGKALPCQARYSNGRNITAESFQLDALREQ